MAKGFTVAEIDTLKCGPRRRELSDGKQTGLYFIIQPSGARSWAYRYRFGGKSKKFTIGPYPAISLAAARAKAAAASVKVVGEVDGRREKSRKDREDRSGRRYHRNHYQAVRCRALQAQVEGAIRARSGAPAHQGNRSPLGRTAAFPYRQKGYPRAFGCNRRTPGADHGEPDFGVAAHAFQLGGQRGVVNANPCIGIRPPADETARDRVLSDDEARGALEGIGWARTALFRIHQAVDLDWCEAERNCRAEVARSRPDAKVWTLPKERAKNAREHTIPLSDLAVEVLKGLPRIDGSDLIFTLNGKNTNQCV